MKKSTLRLHARLMSLWLVTGTLNTKHLFPQPTAPSPKTPLHNHSPHLLNNTPSKEETSSPSAYSSVTHTSQHQTIVHRTIPQSDRSHYFHCRDAPTYRNILTIIRRSSQVLVSPFLILSKKTPKISKRVFLFSKLYCIIMTDVCGRFHSPYSRKFNLFGA